MTTKRGSGVAVRWRSSAAIPPWSRPREAFFPASPASRFDGDFFSRRLLLLLRAGISSLRHETTRHELSRSPTLHPHLNAIEHWPSYPGSTLMARDRTMTEVKSEIVLSIIISILARCVRGTASVGLKAVAVLYPR